jgi:DNA-binding response OmpR family regulator
VSAVLVVDDEPAIRESLAFALKREGFDVLEAGSLKEARALEDRQSDLIILDLVLPDGSGLDFLRALRSRSDIPVIVLTSRDEETDRVVGLEMGADDYVLKPFSPREVTARVRAVLRRAAGKPAPEETELKAGTLSADPRTRKASVGQSELALSRTEFNLLMVFLGSPGRVFERSQLLEAVWGSDVTVGDRTVDVHMKALRRKIEEAGGDPRVLETVRGVGYRLRDDG